MMNKEMALAGELREMIAFGWTNSEAHENEDAFLDRIGEYTDGLTKDDIYRVWNIVWEQERRTFTYRVYKMTDAATENGLDWDKAIWEGEVETVDEIEIPEDENVYQYIYIHFPMYSDTDVYGWEVC